jgi:ankyrin repeat protein
MKYIFLSFLISSSSIMAVELQKAFIKKTSNQETLTAADRKLKMAIQNKDIDGIKEAINQGANPNTDPNPLLLAMSLNDSDLVKFLLEHGADANFIDGNGMSGMQYIDTYGSDKHTREQYKKIRGLLTKQERAKSGTMKKISK